MRVGSFFLACMMLGAVAGILYAADSVWTAWSAYGDTRAAREELIAFRAVSRIPELVAVERVVAVGQLTAPLPAGPPEQQAMAAARTATDAAFDTAVTAVASTHGATEHRDSLLAARATLATMHGAVDRLTSLARPDRATDDLDGVLSPTQAAYLDIGRLLTRIQTGPTLQDSDIQDDLDLSRLAYALRQWAAERGTALIGAIASGKPMGVTTFETLAAAAGHLDEIWTQILNYRDTRKLAPELVAAMATVQERYFGTNLKLYARVQDAGRRGSAYPTLGDFRRDHAPGVMSPFLIRDAAIGDAIAIADRLNARARSTLLIAVGLLALVCGIIAGATWVFTRRVVRALTALTGVITAIAAHNHDVVVPWRGRRDEVGRMADAIEILRRNTMEFAALATRTEAEQRARQLRAERVEQACDAFQHETGITIEAALRSASTMRAGVRTSAELVAEVETRTGGVVTATGQASANMQAIVGSAAQLTQSITDLAEQVRASTAVAAQAEGAVARAAERMGALTAATEKIGAVTGLIRTVAEQTNLLALNATIEAARAGEAGKGFAVVAGEVKALAGQTARATADIAAEIARVQEATTGVAAMIGDIVRTIGEINRLGDNVSHAVDGQRRSTTEIGLHVEEAARGMGAVAADIDDVHAAAARTGGAAGEMADGVAQLTSDAERLTSQIAGFLERVRAA